MLKRSRAWIVEVCVPRGTERRCLLVFVKSLPDTAVLRERFPDRNDRAFFRGRVPRIAHSLEKKGLLRVGEEVQGLVLLQKHPSWKAWFVSMVYDGYAWLVVTEGRVLVSQWTPSGTAVWPKGEFLSLDRPVRLTLTKPVKHRRVSSRNEVQLPDEIATFLGRRKAYIALDAVAADAFDRAGSSPEQPATVEAREAERELAQMGAR
jgi:hypothetical protein